ncbi:hypothetical protein QQ045_008675 [Rhodiola kirilowii]
MILWHCECTLNLWLSNQRLPHIFDKSPPQAAAHLRFSSDLFRQIAADGLGVEIRAEAIEIYPGVTKVVIRGESEDDGYYGLEIDRWRFRLSECTRPEMASAECVGGMLVVIVPKGESLVADDDEDGEIWGDGLDHPLHVWQLQFNEYLVFLRYEYKSNVLKPSNKAQVKDTKPIAKPTSSIFTDADIQGHCCVKDAMLSLHLLDASRKNFALSKL